MRSIGIDIGSRTIKAVIMDNLNITEVRIAENSYDPISTAKHLISDWQADKITATGYGRHLASRIFDAPVLSEIKAAAVGVNHLYPQCRMIIDVGGQDVKVITLDDTGNLAKFEMNDKCAAGTGKFLEVMATALGYTMEEFISAALQTTNSEKISSMCTVFAESEVVSMVAKGISRESIARGLHLSIANRISSMAKRIVNQGPILMIGGGALNSCLVQTLSASLGEIIVPDFYPQACNALGAAIYGLNHNNNKGEHNG
jgi:(R)-2-hydroxyacyl-CoA dehydratese activating ATPase